jgi:hypothetical protein
MGEYALQQSFAELSAQGNGNGSESQPAISQPFDRSGPVPFRMGRI